jgi:hypothetical protein
MTKHRELSTPKDATAFDFSGPATYRVVVQGTLSKDWYGRLGGMAITTSSQETGSPQTILRGRLEDQSALHGLLDTLYALHLPIVEVTKVDHPSGKDTKARERRKTR